MFYTGPSNQVKNGVTTSTLIIEWNAHMFSADTDRYPFHPRATYEPKPEFRLPDPLADYITRMATEGIDRAVLVHPESLWRRLPTGAGMR